MASEVMTVVHEAMDKLLSGDDSVIDTLREQVDSCSDISIEMSGVGFFAYFRLQEGMTLLVGKPSFQIGDVVGNVQWLNCGIGFMLFIESGHIKMLEAYTYEEPWPQEIRHIELKYDSGDLRDLSKLRRSAGWPRGGTVKD